MRRCQTLQITRGQQRKPHRDMTSNRSTLTKYPPKKTQDYSLAKYSKIPDRTVLKGQILKDILVRAKLPKQLLHVDGSPAGVSLHCCHKTIVVRSLRSILSCLKQ